MDEQHVFLQGVSPGSVRSSLEVKILICYLLSSIAKPLTREQLVEVFSQNGLVNYFALTETLGELENLGQIQKIAHNGAEAYQVTALGRETAKSLERSLPAATKEKAVNSALQLLRRMRIECENKVEIEKTQDGYLVKLRMLDVGSDLLDLSLLVPDKLQALAIKDAFLQNPQKLYEGVLDLLTKPE